MSSGAGSLRRDQAEAVIAQELAAQAEGNRGTLPRGYANRVLQTLRTEGAGIRRQAGLRLIHEYAEYLELPGIVTQRSPERFAPAKSAPAQALKREGSLDVVALMRRKGLSLGSAVQEHNTSHPDQRVSAATVKRLVPKALTKQGGRWQPTPYDRYARTTDAITTQGVVRVTVRDSRTASLIARHHGAVRAYLEGRAEETVLRPFRGKSFRATKQTYVLETDPAALERQALGGELDDLVIGSGQELAA